MASMTSQLPVSKGYSRLRPTPAGLKVKTCFSEPGNHTNGRARVIRAVNWREPTTINVSLDESRSRHRSSDEKQESITSSDVSSNFMIEMNDLSQSSVRYRRPKSEQTPWELISSAPAARSHLSHSDIYGLCLNDVTAVQFKDMKPMVVNVNGEDIVLPNRFTFDITPVDLSDTSSETSFVGTMGQLKRVRDPGQLQCKASQRGDLFGEIPDDLRALLNHDDLRSIPEEAPSYSQIEDSNSSTGSVVRGNASPRSTGSKPWADIICATQKSSHLCNSLSEVDSVRFQGMLDRLHKKESQSLVQRSPTSAFDFHFRDPAIIAAKVKEDAVTRSSLGSNGQKREQLLDAVRQPQAARLQRCERSRDSGYGTSSNSQITTASLHSTKGTTRDTSHTQQGSELDNTKRLNPAAAEFKFTSNTFEGAQMPVLVPKRLSRPPLSNLFYDVNAGQIPPQPISTSVRPPPGLAQVVSDVPAVQTQGPALPGEAPNRIFQLGHRPMTQPFLPTLGLADPRTAEINPLPAVSPYMCPPVDVLSRQMTSTVPYSTVLPPPPAASNFGTFSTSPFNPFSVPGPQLNMPNPNSLGTFPPAGGDVAFPLVLPQSDFNHANPLTGLPRPTVQPPGLGPRQQPLVCADGKTVRPHFPVTQKPRDHDPVKQQQYEAYLEWRKANEPGYHIRCKMRQANRIVRQHQMKQSEQKVPDKTDSKPENPAWKTIVEKAKAVVASAAAVAAAEKRARGESVREELRTKIQERRGDVVSSGPQLPALKEPVPTPSGGDDRKEEK